MILALECISIDDVTILKRCESKLGGKSFSRGRSTQSERDQPSLDCNIFGVCIVNCLRDTAGSSCEGFVGRDIRVLINKIIVDSAFWAELFIGHKKGLHLGITKKLLSGS
jgi:hypothetical protein